MSKEIGKSAKMLEKEARIEELKKELKKKRTTLKRLKTRLANTKEEITDIQRTATSTYFRQMSKMMDLKNELVELLKKCRKLKGLSKDDKMQIDGLLSSFEEVDEMEAEYEQFQEKVNQEDFDFDDEQRAKMRDLFMEFQVKPDEKEQRNIRKVFIKLSTHFHPDKARNEKDKKRFHTLMQQINQAYEQGDIDKLLEIEQLYLIFEDHELDTRTITVDVLQQVIERLERDLEFIKNQVTRTSAEIKQLRNSDLGNMLTQVKKSEKQGMGLENITGEMNESLTEMEELRDVLKDCVKKGSLRPLEDMMMQQMVANPFAEIFGDDIGDAGDLFDDLMENLFNVEDDVEVVENPFFPIGSSVRIAEKTPYMFLKKVNMQGWEGRVLSAYIEDGEVFYKIQFDSKTIQQWTLGRAKNLFSQNENFGVIEVPENVLRAAKPRDTIEETITVYRTLRNSIRWYHLDKKDAKQMQNILLVSPEKTDQENWEDWFSKHKIFPTKATHRGFYNHKRGTKTEIVGLYDWHEEAGFLVIIKSNGFATDHPLTDLKIKGKHANDLELYNEWIEML